MSAHAEAAGAAKSGESHLFSAQTPLHIGRVALNVRDLDTVAAFYRDVIGLAEMEKEPGVVRLGAGGRILLELHHEPRAAPNSPRMAGLFHTAFLLPTREDLAQWLVNAVGRGGRLQGASDHLVSEAIYLADPEGNGIEVYRDRPQGEWKRHGGEIVMATEPLDLDELVSKLRGRDWSGMPEQSCVGHVHLRVGDIPAAESFYRDVLGLELTARYPGGSFYSSGGYHHHLASNVWNSRGAGVRPRNSAGLRSFEILARSEEAWADLKRSLAAAPGMEDTGDRITLPDPWGNVIHFRRG